MSLILDALKKADQERRTQQGVPGLDARHPQVQATFPWVGVSLMVIAVAAITAGIVWWWLKPAAPAPEASAGPAVSESSSSRSSAVSSVSASPAASSARQSEREQVANLYRQRQQEPVAQADSEAPSQPESIQSSSVPADTGESSAPTVAEPPSLADFDHVGGVRDLPPSVQNGVPTLMYAGHDYRPEGDSRIIINDEALREGQRLSNGIRVRAIVSDGVVLATDEHLFKLEALSSWVNM